MVYSDYDRRTIGRLTSTPHQPANAYLALGLHPKVGESLPVAEVEITLNQRLGAQVIEIHKLLESLGFWLIT
jgi:hypothetical protein